MNKNDSENFRIIEYDIAKGIGIFLVIIGHALPLGSFLRLVIYSFHMPLFFFLSGAVMEINPYINIRDLLKTEKTLIKNYVFYTVFYLIFDIVVRLIILHIIEVRSIIIEIYQSIVFYGINVLWFISSLMLGKILVKVILAKVKNKKSGVIISILFFFIACMLAQVISQPNKTVPGEFWYPCISLLRVAMISNFILVGFTLSKVIKKYLDECPKILGGELGMLALTVVCVCCIMLYKEGGVNIDIHIMEDGFVPISFILHYVGIIGIIGIAKFITAFPKIANTMVFWGKNSLIVMVTHEYLLIKDLFRWFLLKINWDMDVAIIKILPLAGVIIVEFFIIKLRLLLKSK